MDQPTGHSFVFPHFGLGIGGGGFVDPLNGVFFWGGVIGGRGGRQLSSLRARLDQRGASAQQLRLIDTIIETSGSERRTGDLFGDRNFLKRASKMAKTIRGVENVYTQHQPLLTQTIEDLTKSRLKETDYPFSNRPSSLPTIEPTVRHLLRICDTQQQLIDIDHSFCIRCSLL